MDWQIGHSRRVSAGIRVARFRTTAAAFFFRHMQPSFLNTQHPDQPFPRGGRPGGEARVPWGAGRGPTASSIPGTSVGEL